jgi:hypothetical protein
MDPEPEQRQNRVPTSNAERVPDLSQHGDGAVGIPTMGEILIDLRCTKQRDGCNRKTFDHGGPHGETANRAGRVKAFRNSLPRVATYLQWGLGCRQLVANL